ncbi:MAG: hypothetical protein EOS41_17295 [Mesorhizobium sp.]|uniref:hypothetical protein n=1 Tax=Mesorhizobium sp. TaxID=1871066 RepID=UPI000FE8FBEC|nr:hypothetical protein [Mesorhizobium sp.]RWE24144.1 MAG: hypothetical protein EOS41_17295 [Mesorhizobium sp.]
MEYKIVSDYLSRKVDIDISKEYYEKLSDAITLILKATDAEELFIVCVYNYEDYENTLLKSSLEDMIYQKHHYSEFWSLSTRIHQRLANFLSSCRAYLDQIKSISGKFESAPSSVADNIRTLANQWYDKSISYRIMEGLRNFVQHRGFGVHGLTFGQRWTPKGEEKLHRMHFWLEPHLSRTRLTQDGSVKKKLLAELTNETVPINVHVREYMRAIGELQALFRAETKKAVQEARELVAGALRTYGEQSDGGSTTGAKAIAMDGGARVSEFAILRETLEYHDEITRKVNDLTNLERRVISSAGPE